MQTPSPSSPDRAPPDPSRAAIDDGPRPPARKGAETFAAALRRRRSAPAGGLAKKAPLPRAGRGEGEEDLPSPLRRSKRGDPSPPSAGEGFLPPSPVLSPPLGASAPPPAAGSGVDRARAQAMADRLLQSASLEELGPKSAAVRLRLGPSGRLGALEVSLLEREGELHVEVDAPPGGREAAFAFAETLAGELRDRGIEAAGIDVVA